MEKELLSCDSKVKGSTFYGQMSNFNLLLPKKLISLSRMISFNFICSPSVLRIINLEHEVDSKSARGFLELT